MLTEAIVVSSPGSPFTYKSIHLDSPLHPLEVHVRIKATGICHTDLIFSREPNPDLFPCIMGHEGAGVIVKLGSKVHERHPDLKVGDRVIVVYTCCGECEYCEAGETGYCDLWFRYNFGVGRADVDVDVDTETRSDSKAQRDSGGHADGNGQGQADGKGDGEKLPVKAYRERKSQTRVTGHFFGQSSFARDIYVKATGLVKIDETKFKDVPFEHLAALACGVMTGAGGMLNVVKPQAGGSVAVVGTGSVGLSAIMAVNLVSERKEERPRRVIAVDVVASRLEFARSCGATHGVNNSGSAHPGANLMETLLEITGGTGVNGSIDTTGRGDVVLNLVHSSARRGRVVTIGTGGTKGEVKLNMFEMVQAGAEYVGCQQGNCYPQTFLPWLLEESLKGRFPYQRLVKTYPAKEVSRAMEDMESGKVVKPVLLWD